MVEGDARRGGGGGGRGCRPTRTPTHRPTPGSRHPGSGSAPREGARRADRRADADSRRAPRAGCRATSSLSGAKAALFASAPNRPVRHSTSQGSARSTFACSAAAADHDGALQAREVVALARARDGVADAARSVGHGEERRERHLAVRERTVDLVRDDGGAVRRGDLGEGREALGACARCRWGCADCTAARRARRRRGPPRCRGGRAPSRRPIAAAERARRRRPPLPRCRRTAGTRAA